MLYVSGVTVNFPSSGLNIVMLSSLKLITPSSLVLYHYNFLKQKESTEQGCIIYLQSLTLLLNYLEGFKSRNLKDKADIESNKILKELILK